MQAVNRILQEYFTAGNVEELGVICLKVAEQLLIWSLNIAIM